MEATEATPFIPSYSSMTGRGQSNEFRSVFSNSNATGSNNNQETRFIEQGPLRGDVSGIVGSAKTYYRNSRSPIPLRNSGEWLREHLFGSIALLLRLHCMQLLRKLGYAHPVFC